MDGGACANNLLMQIQADLLNATVVRPKVIETTALGAAILAGIGAGLFSDLDAAKATWAQDRRFEPDPGAYAEDLRGRWADAVAKA